MEYEINKHYPFSELENIAKWWQTHREYDVNEIREPREYVKKPIIETVVETDPETGDEVSKEVVVGEEDVLVERVYDDYVEIVPRSSELIAQDRIYELKAELEQIKEDIEQEAFGLVRDDYADKKRRAGEIINELRALEGKQPRVINLVSLQ